MSNVDPNSNTSEYYTQYQSPSDIFTDVVQNTPIVSPIIIPKTPDIVIKENKRDVTVLKLKIFAAVIFIAIIAFLLISLFINYFQVSGFSNKLIEKYENKAKSAFTNKDQVDFSNENDYDIHYLVEQMIYKEFSPTDKKKYLNLPEALKDNLVQDYLIERI